MKPRRIDYIPLQDRLSAFINAMRARADLVPPGPQRDELLQKAQKAETAVPDDRGGKVGRQAREHKLDNCVPLGA